MNIFFNLNLLFKCFYTGKILSVRFLLTHTLSTSCNVPGTILAGFVSRTILSWNTIGHELEAN